MESLDLMYANKLRYMRFSKNLKQEAIAKEFNMSQQAYSNLENGKTHFADDIIDRIAHYFETTPSEFIKPIDHVYINNSPNTQSNSPHGQYNESKLIEANHLLTIEALKSKDEAILALKAYINKIESK
jgi:transcriptional regulator with XRE-family HTH domain